MLEVSIAGGSGYVGGELMRLIHGHPQLKLAEVTSERSVGRYVHQSHPHLRELPRTKYVSLANLGPCDVLFLALPHGESSKNIEHFAGLASKIIDCSADFRLRDKAVYEATYGTPHPNPEWLDQFVYGLPEANREALSKASWVSGVGCNATATNLALLPLKRANLLPRDSYVVADIKAGSSEGGKSASIAGQHSERSQVMRSYAPTGHRHAAEVEQVCDLDAVNMSITAVDAVRGALATVHLQLEEALDERALWSIYRDVSAEEPFLRVVHERSGIYRHPDPRTLRGTNFADIGWSWDPQRKRLVALAAIDNLVKGAAGSALQSLNLMSGFAEHDGLQFNGLWP